ncbi:sensor histidine kinase [Mobiluncus mulieris]|uniref:Sensor histidine kinase n=1 Tax=Mobiluncus mulieris TaxID=2052 RepID=A0A848RMF8_9ACTO|nr:sensor histidine kinase [Mobiluncus mulieris]MCU9968568.1 sensor histidine kinase [Mobiluncus mulieris]MCU9972803.1 sensor histidine kinase [Mobiluncus mulieris]MCU9993866.1 sensor histidine kinase [Mobiluncus mulieris]MCV0009024.1 sensor histidine kinase [Mobiluncus mulieris]NMW74902.1 sensor histidine kinase [Mobiluncus mulieris]
MKTQLAMATHSQRRGVVVGMVFSSVWLLFLAFPVLAALALPWRARAVSLFLTLAFAVSYTAGIWRSFFPAPTQTRQWRYFDGRYGFRWDTFLIFVLNFCLALSQIPWLGVDSPLMFAPFLVAISSFTIPLLWGQVFGAAVCMIGIVGSFTLARPQDYIGITISTCAVFFGMLGMTFFINNSIAQGREATTQAIAQERERVARDVHDVLGHSLTVIALKSELAGKLVERDPTRAQAEIAAITKLARDSIGELRSTVGGLRVQDLTTELANARQACLAAEIDLRVTGEVADIPPQAQAVFAWGSREAITNVIRHSGASRVEITMTPHSLVVTDNGRGIPDDACGNGLRGLRERVANLGGSLKLTNLAESNSPTAGTKLEVLL